MSNSLWPNELQHTSLPCSLLFPGVCLNSCPLSWWCYLTTLSASATLFSSCPQSLLVSGSFPISQLLHAQPPPAFHQFLSVTGSKDFPFHQISFYGFCLSRFWELQNSLWPHFFDRSKKSYWFPVHFFFPLLWGCDSLFVCMLSRFSHIWLIAILWTIARQAPLSIGFSRQEYWSGLPWPPPRDLPNPWLELHLPLLRCRWILYHWVTEGSMVDYLHALYISHLNLGVWQFFNTSMRLHFLIFYEPEKVKWLQSSPTPEKSWRVLSGKKDIIINFLVALIWAHKFFEMLDNLNARDLQNSISLFILMKESFLGIQVFSVSNLVLYFSFLLDTYFLPNW